MFSKIPNKVFMVIFGILIIAGIYVEAESINRGLPLNNEWLIAIAVSVVGVGIGLTKLRNPK